MKKNINKILFTLVFCLALLLPNFSTAQEESQWIIKDFHSDIIVNQDSSLDITETIIADFLVQKHGIFRYIPVKYQDKIGQNQNINLKLLSITDNLNAEYIWQQSYSDGNQEFKIGNPDKYIFGEQTYVIHYQVDRAINYFDDHDELYWNVTGNDWPTIIESASATVYLPEGITNTEIQTDLYTGRLGSNSSNGQINIDNNQINYTTDSSLIAGDGLTIVAGWPPNIVHQPTVWENLWYILVNNIFYLLPVIALVILLRQYFKHGRDPKGRGTIVPEFSVPKHLTPLEIGTIIDERIDTQDITASIIDLAIRKHLRIETKETKQLFGKSTEITLVKLASDQKISQLNDFEQELIKGLFKSKSTVEISKVKNFHSTVLKIRKLVFQKLTNDGYFPKHPVHVKRIYFSIGLGLLFIGIFSIEFYFSFGIGMILSGILFFIFAPLMPRKTLKGVHLREQMLGLKLYLKTAERYRLKFQEKSQIFEHFLPAATALGVATIWAGKFKNIYTNTEPSWYRGYPGQIYTPLLIINNLNSMQSQISQVNSASTGRSGLGGGGFSGGGFGGGGGGSW